MSEKTFTEAQHVAILTDAVQREVAAATSKVAEELDRARADLTAAQGRIDVLEAEKAAAETKREEVAKEFEDFKASQAEQAAVAARKGDRIKQVKAANPALKEDFFTEERTQRWAEMADEQFADVLDAVALSKPSEGTPAARETAAFTGGASPTGAADTPGAGSTASALLARRRAMAGGAR